MKVQWVDFKCNLHMLYALSPPSTFGVTKLELCLNLHHFMLLDRNLLEMKWQSHFLVHFTLLGPILCSRLPVCSPMHFTWGYTLVVLGIDLIQSKHNDFKLCCIVLFLWVTVHERWTFCLPFQCPIINFKLTIRNTLETPQENFQRQTRTKSCTTGIINNVEIYGM